LTDTTLTVQRPWYHRPEWIGLGLTLAAGGMAATVAYSNGQAQIGQNTKDIAEIKQQIAAMPERLARIETKVDDLTNLEKRRRGTAD